MKNFCLLVAASLSFAACGPELSSEPIADPDVPLTGPVADVGETQQAVTTPPPACQSYMWQWGTCQSQRPVTMASGQAACQIYWWSVARYSNGFKATYSRMGNYAGTCAKATNCPAPACN